MPNFGDEFFSKVEKKTKVNKEVLLSLASKLQNGNIKDEKLLKEVISELSTLTGKPVSEEKEKKIIETIINDKVPNTVTKFID